MKALVLKRTEELAIEEMDIYRDLGEDEVRISVKQVGKAIPARADGARP